MFLWSSGFLKTTRCERDAALLMAKQRQQGRSRRITVGADKAYDTKYFVGTPGS